MGAGGGLGGAVARRLASEGAQVIVADLNGETAEKVAQDLVEGGASAVAREWDLADLGAIPTHLTWVEDQFGPVDVLVNNTGGPPPTPIQGQPPEVWSRHFHLMVLSVISLTDHVVPGMRERRWGRIVTSTSSGVIAPIPNLGLSNALRGSLLGWSKTLSREVAGDGVTCNVVVPGRIATSRTKALDEAKASREGRSPAEVAADSAQSIPVGRYGDPAEYAAAVTFLASECASYITGAILRVDGGLIPSI